MINKILSHLVQSKKDLADLSEFSDKPGIYAIFYIGKDDFPLKDFVLPDHKLLYIGKTEKSQKSRDADTHFKTGKTGSSTVRKSIGALLSQTQKITPIIRSLSDVEKGRTSHYKFDETSEEIVTQWMMDHLAVSFFEYPKSKEEIDLLETKLIKSVYPVLNIDYKNDNNPHKAVISTLRKQLGIKAHSDFRSRNSLVGAKHEVKKEKVINVLPKTSIQSTKATGKTFVLPKAGNTITQSDIAKGVLRITVDFKEYFPTKDSIIEVWVNDKKFEVNYTLKEERSSLLKIGKEVIDLVGLKANESVKFEKLESGIFKISKVN